jgi:hypothetical protein
LVQAIRVSGGDVGWFVASLLLAYMKSGERLLRDLDAVKAFAPGVAFSASNRVPYCFPGLKVRVFDGFNVGKRAPELRHFRTRGSTDRYGANGPATTQPFEAPVARLPHFAILDAGSSKPDPLVSAQAHDTSDLPPADAWRVRMHACTFTDGLRATLNKRRSRHDTCLRAEPAPDLIRGRGTLTQIDRASFKAAGQSAARNFLRNLKGRLRYHRWVEQAVSE